MLKRRDPHSGALLFSQTPADKQKTKQNKVINTLEKDNISVHKKIKNLQIKTRALDKRIKELEDIIKKTSKGKK